MKKPLHILYICNPASIHDVKWFTFFANRPDDYRVFVVGELPNVPDYDNMKRTLADKGVNLLPPIASFSIRAPLTTYRSIKALRTYCKDNEIDLVHVLFAAPHALWCKFLQTPYVITTRGSDILLVIPALLRGGLYPKWLFGVFKQVFLQARAITATSDKQAEKALSLFGLSRLPEVIRTGVDVERIEGLTNDAFLPAALRNRVFVFSPRYISPLYNTLLQLDAIALLPQEIIDNCLFVFIRGVKYDTGYLLQVQQALLQLQQRKGLRYEIIDYLSQEAIWTCFKYARLTINTPVSDGTPNSCLEAMAAGCGLVIPDIGYDKLLFSDNCFIYEPGNTQQLADFITRGVEAYPASYRNKALHDVRLFGNRTIEMNKLDQLYKALTA